MHGDLIKEFGDLSEDTNLVNFFKAVLERRDHKEEEERSTSVSDTLGASSVPGLPGYGHAGWGILFHLQTNFEI